MQGNLVSTKEGSPGSEPRRSRLRQILDEQPQARSRLGHAVAVLLGTSLVALAAIGALVIWHLVRRGRLIRGAIESAPQGLAARNTRLTKTIDHHERQADLSPARTNQASGRFPAGVRAAAIRIRRYPGGLRGRERPRSSATGDLRLAEERFATRPRATGSSV